MNWLAGLGVSVAIFLTSLVGGAFTLLISRHTAPVSNPLSNVSTTPSPTCATQSLPLTSASVHDPAYSIVNGAIYNGGQTLSEADAGSFSVFVDATGRVTLSRDKTHVYQGSVIIPSADPATICPIMDHEGRWTGFSVDRMHIYFVASELNGADPTTFKWLGRVSDREIEVGQYAKDFAHVYFASIGDDISMVADAHPAGFHLALPDTVGNDYYDVISCGPQCRFDAVDGARKFHLGAIVH